MKTIIAGSRTIVDKIFIKKAIRNSKFIITEIVSGGARGVDSIAIEIAKEWSIEYVVFPAQWNIYGKSAGFIRNKQMAEYSDALIAIWDGESRGTLNMIETASKFGLEIFVEKY